MTIDKEAATRRLRAQTVKIKRAYVVVAGLFCFSPFSPVLRVTGAPHALWGVRVVAVATVTLAIMLLLAREVLQERRDGTVDGGRGDRPGDAFVLAWGVWVLGGVLDLSLRLFVLHPCDGTGGGSFECVNMAGPALDRIGFACAASTFPVLLVVNIFGRHSRGAAWLSPALVLSLYLLAASLWEPHVGLGVPERNPAAL